MSRHVGKYELVDLLGRGGCGEVWRALDTELDRVVALKLLQRTSPEDLARFRREAHAVARLNHPNVAQLYEATETYLAMQHVEGAPISKPEHLAAAARAVHFAHEQGILHRDLKPANILVDASGRTFVLDFGLAREVKGEQTAMSVTGDVLGTPSYMSPEQARGDVAHLDARADVYGLGATLYALIEGRPPHTGPTAYDVVRRVIEEDPSPPSGELGTIAMKALEKDPARRYATAAEFADDLDRHFRDEPIRARPASIAVRLGKHIRRRPVVWALAATLLAAVVGGGAFGLHYLFQAKTNLERALREERGRVDQARAQALVEEARSMLGDVNAAMYIEGCSLEPYGEVLDRVRARCREALDASPGCAEAHAWIGRSYVIEGRYEEAVEALRRGAAWADLAGVILARGIRRHLDVSLTEEERRRAMEEGADEALRCLDRAGSPSGGIRREAAAAYRLFAQDRGDELRSLAVEAWRTHGAVPGIEDLEFLVGAVSSGPEEIAHYDRAIGVRPGFFLACQCRGNARFEAGDSEGAIADYDRAIEIQPTFSNAYYNRGVVRHVAGDRTGAIADYGRAIERDPDNAAAYVNRGLARQESGDAAEAMADYDRAIAIRPGFANAYYNRGNARADAGDVPGALADYGRAIDLDPFELSARINRGLIRQQAGDLPGALADFDRAAEIDPGDATVYYDRGSARRDAGDLPGAIADLRRAVEIRPDFADARDNLGEALRAAGDVAGALAEFDRAIRADPGNPWALANRALARLDLGDAAGAAADLRAALRAAPAGWPDRARTEALLRDVERRLPPQPEYR